MLDDANVEVIGLQMLQNVIGSGDTIMKERRKRLPWRKKTMIRRRKGVKFKIKRSSEKTNKKNQVGRFGGQGGGSYWTTRLWDWKPFRNMLWDGKNIHKVKKWEKNLIKNVFKDHIQIGPIGTFESPCLLLWAPTSLFPHSWLSGRCMHEQ